MVRGKTKILSEDEIRRSLVRIAHEIVERNNGIRNVVLVGILTRGAFIAKRIGKFIENIEQQRVPVGELDVRPFRDDEKRSAEDRSSIEFRLDGRTVVLIDDVLFTGRTVRSALDALTHRGRPSAVQLAVLVDRGHRELPIRPDFVGKNLPTSKTRERVSVKVKELDGEDAVYIVHMEE